VPFLLPLVPTALGFGAKWIISFLVGFYTAVIAVFMRHVKTVLTALLEERDPEQRRILHEVLRDLLEPFRREKRR
jgi:hypothetical protein